MYFDGDPHMGAQSPNLIAFKGMLKQRFQSDYKVCI